VVQDIPGAAMAGATFEAASRALIEKVHTAATPGQGQFYVVDQTIDGRP
jgi:hypothetical protein